jgi:hypothetical protein
MARSAVAFRGCGALPPALQRGAVAMTAETGVPQPAVLSLGASAGPGLIGGPADVAVRPWLLARSRPEFEIALWCLFYIAVFTPIQLISHGPGDLVNDTLEAVAWGQHPQLGYCKHPPFWAWIAFGWFKLFPFAEWSAYLLASVNAAIGLVCSWYVARRFLSVERATGAMLALMLSATYLCLAQRFNANTILISLWPATTLAVLRTVERNRIADGLLAGLLATFCLLSKYYSAIYLITLLVAVGPIMGSAKVYRSRAALTCYTVATLALLPHLIWMQQNDFLPLTYARIATARTWPEPLRESAFFLLITPAFVAIGTAAYLLAAGTAFRRLPAVLLGGFRGRRGAVAILAFGTGLLTVLGALLFSCSVRPIYAIPMLFPIPIWLAMAPQVHFNATSLNRLRWMVLAVFAFCLAAAPVVAFSFAKFDVRSARRPKDEIIGVVTQEWHRFYAQPLRIVAGDEDYAIAAPFYSADHPAYLVGFDQRVLEDFNLPMNQGPKHFDFRLSPWIDAAAIKRDGMAIICSQERWGRPTKCDAEAARWLGERGVQMKLSVTDQGIFAGGPVFNFHIYFLPPA